MSGLSSQGELPQCAARGLPDEPPGRSQGELPQCAARGLPDEPPGRSQGELPQCATRRYPSDRSVGGLGIGLALVKRLVEMHGGTVVAHSAGAGHGSEFVCRLPLLAASLQPALAPAGAAMPVPPTGWRILVVDDNRDAADSLAAILSMEGHHIHVANDGAQALELASALRPEVVLLDLGLPTLNGYQVCRALREQAWGKETVVVALTGWGQDEQRARTSEAGFDAHIVKPVDPDGLTSLLLSLRAPAAQPLTPT